jgi:hypothetical protein
VATVKPKAESKAKSTKTKTNGVRPTTNANKHMEKGILKTVAEISREAALATGLLPHEWLLKIARGEPIVQKRWVHDFDKEGRSLSRELVEDVVFPTIDQRIDCAKAAAPYYAARISIQHNTHSSTEDLATVMKEVAGKLPV